MQDVSVSVSAWLIGAPGHQPGTLTAVSVLDHARGRLARFKVRAYLYLGFVEAFPMRLQKGELLEQDRDQRTGVFDVAANTWV